MLTLAEILERAQVEARRLITYDTWIAGYSHAAPRAAALVKGETDADPVYYLVDFRTEGRPTGRMILDARTGSLEEAAGVVPGDPALSEFLTDAELLPYLHTQKIPFDQAAELQVDPTLFWKPCDQSLSAFQPFYVVHAGARVLYVRIDGQIFTELTDHGAGA